MRHFAIASLISLAFGAAYATTNNSSITVSPDGPYESGTLFVPCTMDEAQGLCNLDSGSAMSNVPDKGAFAVYPSVGKISWNGVSGAPITCDKILIRKFEAGSRVIPMHRVMRCAGEEQRPVAGFDIFRDKTVGLNFTIGKLSFGDGPIRQKFLPQVYKTSDDLVHLPVNIGNIQVSGLWDTGAGLSNVNKKFAKAHPESFIKIKELSNGTDFNGVPLTIDIYSVKEIKIGAKTFADSIVAGIDMPDDTSDPAQFSIGFNIIRHSNWYVDARTHSWATY